jgi:hypothetical protein
MPEDVVRDSGVGVEEERERDQQQRLFADRKTPYADRKRPFIPLQGHVTGPYLLMIIVESIPQSFSRRQFAPSLSGQGLITRGYHRRNGDEEERQRDQLSPGERQVIYLT